MANTPAVETPWLLILHPAQLAGREAREEGELKHRWRWCQQTPGDDNTINGRAVLVEAANSMHTWQLFSKGRVNIDRVAGYEIGGKLTGPIDRVLDVKV